MRDKIAAELQVLRIMSTDSTSAPSKKMHSKELPRSEHTLNTESKLLNQKSKIISTLVNQKQSQL